MTFTKECRKCCDVFPLQTTWKQNCCGNKATPNMLNLLTQLVQKKRKKLQVSNLKQQKQQQQMSCICSTDVMCIATSHFPACCAQGVDEPQLFRWSSGFAAHYIRDFPLELRLLDVGTTQLLKKQDIEREQFPPASFWPWSEAHSKTKTSTGRANSPNAPRIISTAAFSIQNRLCKSSIATCKWLNWFLVIFQTISQVLSAPEKQNINIKVGISSLQIFHLMFHFNSGHKKLSAAVKNLF